MTIQLVENIMSREVITAATDMALGEILSLLSEHKISFVVVREGSKPVGVITERDIVRLTAEDLDSSQLTARDVMSTPVVVSRGSEVDIAEAYHRLKLQNKRHLVIVSESGDIQGVVTLTDFIKHLGFATHSFRHDFGDRRCQCRLTMVNVTNRSHTDIRFRSFKFFLGHAATLFL